VILKLILLASSLVICTTWSQPSNSGGIGDGIPAVKASMNGPSGIAVDGSILYVIESFGNFIRRVNLTTGIITTVHTQIPLKAIDSITVDSSGDLIVTEFTVDRVRRIHPQDGSVTTVAGGIRQRFSGDGGPAASAGLSRPSYTTFDAKGNLYIVDMGNNRIRRVDALTGIISTVAGNGEQNSTGDGGPALEAGLEYPNSVVVDASGNLYIAQFGYGPNSHRIRRVDARSGIITTIAGLGKEGLHGDGGSALQASLDYPSDLLIDKKGNILVVNIDRIRRIDAITKVITTVVGTTKGFAGDGGPATKAKLNNPSALAFDSAGNLYISEFVNNRVRRVGASTGVITTIAGNGLPERVDALL